MRKAETSTGKTGWGRGYGKLVNDLRGRTARVYFFRGADEFLKREGLSRLVEALVPPEGRQFNCQSFLAADSSWGDVEVACLSAPLFAEKRVVTVSGLETWPASDVSSFGKYIKRPSDSTCLVAMTTRAGEEGRRQSVNALARLVAAAREEASSYDFRACEAEGCVAWVADWLKRNKRNMEAGLVAQLLDSCGNSCYEVWNVLEKAVGYAGDAGELKYEHLTAVGDAASLGSAEEFRKAVAQGDSVRAHGNATRSLAAGMQATALLWRLNWSFREALRVYEGRGEEKPVWHQAQVVEAILRRFDEQGLCRAIGLIYETEKGVKSGSVKPELALELLINGLTS